MDRRGKKPNARFGKGLLVYHNAVPGNPGDISEN